MDVLLIGGRAQANGISDYHFFNEENAL